MENADEAGDGLRVWMLPERGRDQELAGEEGDVEGILQRDEERSRGRKEPWSVLLVGVCLEGPEERLEKAIGRHVCWCWSRKSGGVESALRAEAIGPLL